MGMISELEIHEVVACKPETSIIEVAKILRDKRVRHIYVTDDDDRPIGVLSALDINNKLVAEGKDAADVTASDVMNHPVDTVDIKQECEFAMKIMIERRTYSAPVVEDGRLKGAVGYRAVAEKIASKLYEEEKEPDRKDVA